MTNHLKDQASPYLLQHAENPVDWFPWSEEAFQKAKSEDKPIFLSIGYSTCHWCHVMAHESFEDPQTAQILNTHFVSIKVDKEERPDIDAIYMAVCQAFTGSGGWPCSIFMTPDQKPFFAGTYFPKNSRRGVIGFQDLLFAIAKEWQENRSELIRSAEHIVKSLKETDNRPSLSSREHFSPENADSLIHRALLDYSHSFDPQHGGFGSAPKFPCPHNLLFLMRQYALTKDQKPLEMAEKTLLQMYRGGIFDHIGFGFSRYSTDPYFLAPHFEKMLYDNALLILAYACAFGITGNSLYQEIAEKTAAYILREMTDPKGAFYSAQDADSEGEEGKYYLLGYEEVLLVLGEDAGETFIRHYGITPSGNFEGKNIPNLLASQEDFDLDAECQQLYRYRQTRAHLHLDDKILTSWNALMITALAFLSKVTAKECYLTAAKKAQKFIDETLFDGQILHVGCRKDARFGKGFLDDYAFSCMALLALYDATYDRTFLDKALALCRLTLSQFYDSEHGGFSFYGQNNESLIFNPKETYDGAMPSGNSVMCCNLVRLSQLTEDSEIEKAAQRQLAFLYQNACSYPSGYSFFLLSLSLFLDPPQKLTVVLSKDDSRQMLRSTLPFTANVIVLDSPTEEYRLLNGQTTYYICKGHSCQPPTNRLTL